jgi:chromate transport protein ChrA
MDTDPQHQPSAGTELAGGCMAALIALFAFSTVGSIVMLILAHVLRSFRNNWLTQLVPVVGFLMIILGSLYLGLRVKRAMVRGE